jgi:hypothetical protein
MPNSQQPAEHRSAWSYPRFALSDQRAPSHRQNQGFKDVRYSREHDKGVHEERDQPCSESARGDS